MLILSFVITLLIFPHDANNMRKKDKNVDIDTTSSSWSWRHPGIEERLNKQVQHSSSSNSEFCLANAEDDKRFCDTTVPESPSSLNSEFHLEKQSTKVKEAAAVGKRKKKMNNLVALEFEVHGKVQGVYFRKFTKSKSDELGLRGWVRNTAKGTVVGELEGPQDKVKTMKKWLRETGSPKSEIKRAEFRNERNIPVFSLSAFDIRK